MEESIGFVNHLPPIVFGNLQVPRSKVVVKANKELDSNFWRIGGESLENISGKENRTYSNRF